jgi:hypothetical protein
MSHQPPDKDVKADEAAAAAGATVAVDARPSEGEEGQEPNISNEPTFLGSKDEQAVPKEPEADAGATRLLDREPAPADAADAGATVRTDARPSAPAPAPEPAEKPAAKHQRLASSTKVLDKKLHDSPALAYLLVGSLALLVLGVVGIGWKQSRSPSDFDLQWSYLKSFRIPEEASPPAEMVTFEFEKAVDCTGHEGDRCLVYRLTGPKLNTTMTVYKAPGGWTRESGDKLVR